MRSRIFVLLIGVLLTFACYNETRQTNGEDQLRTTVRVDNQNFLDMTVYVLNGGQRVRLGTVTGKNVQVFEIPDHLVVGAANLRFLADPVGARQSPVSQEITVTPGDQVELIIPF